MLIFMTIVQCHPQIVWHPPKILQMTRKRKKSRSLLVKLLFEKNKDDLSISVCGVMKLGIFSFCDELSSTVYEISKVQFSVYELSSSVYGIKQVKFLRYEVSILVYELKLGACCEVNV